MPTYDSTCPVCGKTFTRYTSQTAKYCSVACKSKAHTYIQPRPCLQCGKIFTPPTISTGRKYCSVECRNASMQKYNHEPKPCVICGKLFRPKTDSSKYCGTECMAIGQTKLAPVICAHCGIAFIPAKSGKLYCSHKCYAESMIGVHSRKGKDFTRAVRRVIRERDGGKCVACGSTKQLEFDHVTPASLGGDNSIGNGQLLCHKCHLEKSLHQRPLTHNRKR